jgi:K+-transporting ATPase A subunit
VLRFGEVVGDRRQGRAILWAMTLIFIVCVAVVMWAKPAVTRLLSWARTAA